MTFFDILNILGMIALGAAKLMVFFLILCVVLAALAYSTEYIYTPIARRTPGWVGKAFSRFFHIVFVVGGTIVGLAILYAIGKGPVI